MHPFPQTLFKDYHLLVNVITGIEITSVFKWMMVFQMDNFYIEPIRPVLDIRKGSLIEVVTRS